MNEFDLSELGIKSKTKLHGKLTIINKNGNGPVVFLFDEHHGNLNDCITRNIENARTLISNCNIELIGVESLAGGIEWDKETEDYVEDDSNERVYKEFTIKGWKNGCTTFSDSLYQDNSGLIIGVESVGMMDKTELDIINSNPEDQNEAIKNHPLTKLRSKHFIQTLLNHYISNNLKGNIILNCGKNHNSHIQEWIETGEINQIVGINAIYVRLNTF
ncbi:hypothetical protein [uncultured Algoriphagus sp.]|uniref:hypothetical protein n=1 Tax=uncultured Algoriphagus sp. TaxID=417365 RepID=UPI0025950ABD|nr:hypothetical protein [uncultured Algoriphagus sp.]